jgi:hypothetical protein
VNNSGDISWHKNRVFINEIFRFKAAMSGQLALVTGASSGIGLELGRELAKRGV